MFLKKVTLLRDSISSFREYPLSIPSIHSMDQIELKKSVTFFVGENGSGKSTLLEGIAEVCGFNTASGGKDHTYDVHASTSDLAEHLRLSWLPKVSNGFFLRAESFYHFATYLEEVDTTGFRKYGGESLHRQSHGEAFLSLFLHSFKEQSIFLLDEPEAALSPSRQLTLLRILHDLTKDGQAQFIIATHSPILLGFPDADILSFDEGQIKPINYENTNHYQITKYFLNHREKFLNDMFKEDDD